MPSYRHPPEYLPQPPPLILDSLRVVNGALEGIARSQHTRSNAKQRLLLDAFSNPQYGLERQHLIIYGAVMVIADSLGPESPKTEAFVHGAQIGNLALGYHFNFHIPVLSYAACAAYDLALAETEDTPNTVAVTSSKGMEAGWKVYEVNPALTELIDVVGDQPAIMEPSTVQAAAGYVVYLAGHAQAYKAYQDAQAELRRLPEGFFGDLSPEDFQ